MEDEKAKAMSIKLPMDAIESARIVSAYRDRTMTGVKGNIPRPALAEMERKAWATGRTNLDRSNLMSTITPTRQASSPPTFSTAPVLYRMTVDEYERIGEMLDDPRVELIDGHLVKKMPKNPEHSWATKQVLKALERLLPAGWTWRTEQPVRIPAYDEPEPDVSIVRGSDDDYMHRMPGPADVALLVEISESTLATDRGEKLRTYARAAIPIYWIVNLVDRQVEVYTGPGVDDYATRRDFRPGQQVPLVIDGQQLGQIAVDDILPLPLTNS
ncbi:MAG: Uma2 family endonuclease [Isosphaeraceae bacterium]